MSTSQNARGSKATAPTERRPMAPVDSSRALKTASTSETGAQLAEVARIRGPIMKPVHRWSPLLFARTCATGQLEKSLSGSSCRSALLSCVPGFSAS